MSTIRHALTIDAPPERIIERTELVFRVRPAGSQTRLGFAHERWAADTDYFVSCNTVWGHLMFRLKDAAEGAAGARPLFTKSGMAAGAAPLY